MLRFIFTRFKSSVNTKTVPEVVNDLQVDLKKSAKTHSFHKKTLAMTSNEALNYPKSDLVAVPLEETKSEFFNWKSKIENAVSELKLEVHELKIKNQALEPLEPLAFLFLVTQIIKQYQPKIIADSFFPSIIFSRNMNSFLTFDSIYKKVKQINKKIEKEEDDAEFLKCFDKLKSSINHPFITSPNKIGQFINERNKHGHPDLELLSFQSKKSNIQKFIVKKPEYSEIGTLAITLLEYIENKNY